MSAIKKIVVPTDFSASADLALEYVAELTKDYPEKEVTFIHVTDKVEEGLEEKLESIKKEFKSISEASCHALYRVGDLTQEILQFQSKHGCDLILMGTEGREGEEVLSHGSDVMLEADCPVMLIPTSTSVKAVKNIALALDKEAIDNSASLEVLHGLAREKDAKIHVITIDTEEKGEYRVLETNEDILDYYLETLDWKYVFPGSKDIEKGINDYVEQNSIDLLTILPRNHARKNEPSKGKLTKVLSLHSKVPVLAID